MLEQAQNGSDLSSNEMQNCDKVAKHSPCVDEINK